MSMIVPVTGWSVVQMFRYGRTDGPFDVMALEWDSKQEPYSKGRPCNAVIDYHGYPQRERLGRYMERGIICVSHLVRAGGKEAIQEALGREGYVCRSAKGDPLRAHSWKGGSECQRCGEARRST